MPDNHQKNIATFIHLSTFSRFFIPFGNFIGPLILWVMNKDKSEFIDKNGKQAINFQMSILLYVLIIGMITIPFFLWNLISGLNFIDINVFNNIQINLSKPSPLLYITGGLGFLAVCGFFVELLLIVKAALTAKDGAVYKYPFTIKFLK